MEIGKLHGPVEAYPERDIEGVATTKMSWRRGEAQPAWKAQTSSAPARGAPPPPPPDRFASAPARGAPPPPPPGGPAPKPRNSYKASAASPPPPPPTPERNDGEYSNALGVEDIGKVAQPEWLQQDEDEEEECSNELGIKAPRKLAPGRTAWIRTPSKIKDEDEKNKNKEAEYSSALGTEVSGRVKIPSYADKSPDQPARAPSRGPRQRSPSNPDQASKSQERTRPDAPITIGVTRSHSFSNSLDAMAEEELRGMTSTDIKTWLRAKGVPEKDFSSRFSRDALIEFVKKQRPDLITM